MNRDSVPYVFISECISGQRYDERKSRMSDFGRSGFSATQVASSTRADEVIQQYRGQEARLTRRLRWLTGLVVVAVAVSIYAISAGDAPHTGTVIAAALLCLGAAGQTRVARNRVREQLKSGDAEKIATRIAHAQANPRPVGEPAMFRQQYCRVNRQMAGGRLQAGAGMAMFMVVVRDTLLTVIQAPATPVMQVPASSIQIATPKLQRRLGTVTTLRIGEQFWGFDFTAVYQAEKGVSFMRQMFSLGSPRKSTRLAREINKRFVAALVESGASQAQI